MKYEDLNLTEDELDDLQEQLNNRKTKKLYQENLDAIERNRVYIGKCYKEPKKDKYIRVLSSKSSNQFRLECMCFEFPIKVEQKLYLRKIFHPDCAFGEIDFEGIYVEDYPLLCSSMSLKGRGQIVDTLEEISEDVYFEKMNEYITTLQTMIKNGDFDTSKKK